MSEKQTYQLQQTSILSVCEPTPEELAAAAEAAKLADSAKLQSQIDAAVAEATKGLKNKNDELLGKMKALSDKAKEYEGMDPAQMKALKERLDADDDARLLAEGKKHEVISKYTQRMQAEHAAQLEAERVLTKQQSDRADTYKSAVLDNQIRAVTGGLHKGAVEDALLHARNIFSLDAKGNAVQLDTDGRPVLGKDGQNPFSPAEWIELQKETKPHWFPASSSGSGSGGSQSGQGSAKTITRANFEKLSPTEQGVTARSGTKIVD